MGMKDNNKRIVNDYHDIIRRGSYRKKKNERDDRKKEGSEKARPREGLEGIEREDETFLILCG